LDITQETPTEILPTESSTTCLESGSILILVLGVDLPETDFPKGADAIRFVEVDFTNQEVIMLAVPRDLWLQTPALEIQGYDAERLGQTYHIGKNLATTNEDEIRQGTSLLTQTFYDNFGLFPDHYITLNMEAFSEMVDSIGGVNVTIPQDFAGARYSFLAGQQDFTGAMLMDYSRTLLVGTEWDRLNRQDLVMQALRDKLLSAGIIPEIPTILSQFPDIVTTDLSPQQIISLGCMIQNVPAERIGFFEITPDMVSVTSDNLMLPDVDRITTFMDDLFEH
jgi:LCP family protein required for cell wall assembly